MKNVNQLEQLVKLDPTYLTVKGDQLALEDRRTGKVYITTKPYINKLFDDMGYRSLNVVNILKEFAGKVISNVGELKTVNVYSNEAESTCIIATPAAIQWTKDLSDFLAENGFTNISSNSIDACCSQDEFIFKSSNGTYFALDIDFVYEEATLYSMNDITTAIKVMPEGTYHLTESDGIESIKATLMSKINLSTVFDNSAQLSVHEYNELLNRLGIVRKRRGSDIWNITDLGEEEVMTGMIPNIDSNIEMINELSWIKAHVMPSGVTFEQMCNVLTYKFDSIFVSKFADYFSKNSMEKSDYFLAK